MYILLISDHNGDVHLKTLDSIFSPSKFSVHRDTIPLARGSGNMGAASFRLAPAAREAFAVNNSFNLILFKVRELYRIVTET